ncbi:MAG TPA: sigma factor-like helix-turn-helix DNA-binding protein [Acidimicrobiia bacterium]|nr:sigma factor-like helix-turn-helix DNA-binding protein [Acidimicrobiia bacterium]
MLDEIVVEGFTEWAGTAEPRVRHAVTAAFGPQIGSDATAEALAIAWQRWGEVRAKSNPVGYVYGIARNAARRMARSRAPVSLPDVPQHLPRVEPALPGALAALPEQQRLVVSLLYGYEWTMSEVAELLGIAKTTVQNHAERGLRSLREALGVDR